MSKRHISLGVTVNGAEDYLRTFQELAEHAVRLGALHEHASVHAVRLTEDDREIPPEDPEGLYYDEYTMLKVHEAITDAVGPYGHGESYVRDIIHALQNAGILFRERPKNDE